MSVEGSEGNGDRMLSAYQRKLWALTYSCLLKFNCPVMFEEDKLSVANRKESTIVFFVPRTHDLAKEVIEYILDELADEQRASSVIGETTFPGCSVHVVEFNGIDFYHTAAEIQEMADGLMRDLMSRLSRTVN